MQPEVHTPTDPKSPNALVEPCFCSHCGAPLRNKATDGPVIAALVDRVKQEMAADFPPLEQPS